MHEIDTSDKGLKVAPFFGKLTMERVIKDESGKQNAGSLVFRIKRTSPMNDDSGIKCSSPSSDEMSTEEQTEHCRSPIRVRIPKALLDTADNSVKLHKHESNFSDILATPNEIGDSDTSKNDLTFKSVETGSAIANEKNDVFNISNDDKNLGNVETEIINTGMKSNYFNALSSGGSLTGDSDASKNDLTFKSVETESAIANMKNDVFNISNGDKNLGNVETVIINTGMKSNSSNALSSGGSLKNVETDSGNAHRTNFIPETTFKIRKRTRRSLKFEIPIELRRRSRRIVHRQLQKEYQQDSSVSTASNEEFKHDFKEEDISRNGYNINQSVPAFIVKRRRKRRVVPKVVEVKQRKYNRRGRPTKLAVQSSFDIKQETWPPISGPNNVIPDSAMFQPTSSSVWTLVPRSLFQSDFFKSQVLKVRPIQPLEQYRFPPPDYHYPPPVTQSVPCISRPRIRLKYPTNVVNKVPETHPKMAVCENSKRPTVIYFNKKYNTCLNTNQASTINLQAIYSNKTESMKIHDDLLYLKNKYRMLDEAVVKNCYELNKRNINETDSTLTDLFSSNLNTTSNDVIENVYIKQEGLPMSVSDVEPTDVNSTLSGIDDPSQSELSSCENTDTLYREVIVESLRILFDEEAVLL